MTGKYLTSKTIFSKKVNLMKYPVYTDIHVGEDLEFIIPVFFWCIPLPLDHEIYTKWKKTNYLTWLKLYLVIMSALEIKVNKHKNSHLSFSTKKLNTKSKNLKWSWTTSREKISLSMRLFWKEQQKYLQSSQNNATCHPHEPWY